MFIPHLLLFLFTLVAGEESGKGHGFILALLLAHIIFMQHRSGVTKDRIGPVLALGAGQSSIREAEHESPHTKLG